MFPTDTPLPSVCLCAGEGPGSPPQAVMSRPMVPNGGYNTPSPNNTPAGFGGAYQLMYNPCLFGKMIRKWTICFSRSF